jgi:hypothetical protein
VKYCNWIEAEILVVFLFLHRACDVTDKETVRNLQEEGGEKAM